MPDKEKPLPKPPATPFGGKKRFEDAKEDAPLIADRIAQAAAAGKLEEFMQKEIPDNEQARKLVSMMMGMTGMIPPEGVKEKIENTEESAPSSQPPEDVLNAVQAGDVKDLVELLAREHRKRTGGSEELKREEKAKKSPKLSAPEKKAFDELMKMASDNNVSIDWLMLRALKVYIQGYKKTGRL